MYVCICRPEDLDVCVRVGSFEVEVEKFNDGGNGREKGLGMRPLITFDN